MNMKTIGLIGGMSWESTVLYYQAINREVGQRLGGLHSASIRMVSVDFEEIASRQRSGDWKGMRRLLTDYAVQLERSGAHCVLICTNTMHRVADAVQEAINIPLLHIADVTAKAIRDRKLDTVGLLGTRFTMEQEFYVAQLGWHGVRCIVLGDEGRVEIHQIIFDEFCKGKFSALSKSRLQRACEELRQRGAGGIVLGGTELPMLLGQEDVALPLFDTASLHAQAAVDFALDDSTDRMLVA
jgi:aspartate racemase